ncbi:Serpentine Receptor, class BC (Class B-like) [Caenorhabditis elegans]|uniref:Serpentine Receptor, class BC (Class B-like) n=1 Tax=Caenorhabditis elegans TaxID=6239 RepID=Q5TEB3_CAEEL|nr:Serpentine Receptor, class BC (Class B-like) [Caenorhabditis elegans]CAI06051.1 Serpentine Receptor, class BC (Class B-like) [Caenorhabditis elegans]|eukprot:NP_001022954.1 Uncharacterized protein CELE_Y79H2A.12 [Caenorhabditis elegans]
MSYGGPPRIFCVQTRHVIIFFSIFELFLCGWQTVLNEDRITRTTGTISAILTLVILYSVVKNRASLLKIAMYISIFQLAFEFGEILVTPVYFSSQVASGYESNDTYPNFLGVKTAEEDRFVIGLLTGYSVEIIMTISVTLSIIKFILINRCYVYAKRIENGMLVRQSDLTNVMKF